MTGRRLFLDTVPDDFDPANDLVLGPSCFVGREYVWPEWDRQSYSDPLEDPDVQWRDWMRTRILANRMCRTMGNELNLRHGTDYGHRYWRELIVLWLLLLIQSTWLRYLQVNAAIDRWGGETLTVPIAGEATGWRFSDDLDFFHNGPKNPDYDLWICTQILQLRTPTSWTLVRGRAVGYLADAPPPPQRASLKHRLVSLFIRRRAVYNLTDAGAAEWLLSLLVPFLPRRAQKLQPLVDETTEAASTEPFPAAFLELIGRLVTQTMPETLTTSFAEFDRRAAALPYRSGRLFVSGASKYVPTTRFMTAHALEKGERVMRYQHGAFYGSAHIMIGHEIEYYDHGFISWGWRDDGRTPTPAIALPAPNLSRIFERHAQQYDDIILVGTNIELGPYPFKPSPQAGGVLDYRRRKIRLINALAPDSRDKLKYRPYVNTGSDLEDLTYVELETGPIPEVKGALYSTLFTCELVIIDHPSSVMYQSFAANVPTILTWDPLAWPMHERGAAELETLRRAGIFVADPQAAAERINEISDDIEAWWSSEVVQTARKTWCDGNAILKKRWFGSWIRALANTP
jgi:putative transferase (TIGR04331 family)